MARRFITILFSRVITFFLVGGPIGFIAGISLSPVIGVIISALISVCAGYFSITRKAKNKVVTTLRLTGLMGLIWGILAGSMVGIVALNNGWFTPSYQDLNDELTEAILPYREPSSRYIEALVNQRAVKDSSIHDLDSLEQVLRDSFYIAYIEDSVRLRIGVGVAIFEYRYHRAILMHHVPTVQNFLTDSIQIFEASGIDLRPPTETGAGLKANETQEFQFIGRLLRTDSKTMMDLINSTDAYPKIKDIARSCKSDTILIRKCLKDRQDQLSRLP